MNDMINLEVYMNKKNEFFDYVWSFYGPMQIYGDFFDNNLTADELHNAIKIRKQYKGFKFHSDSIDREMVRDIIFFLRGKKTDLEYDVKFIMQTLTKPKIKIQDIKINN